ALRPRDIPGLREQRYLPTGIPVVMALDRIDDINGADVAMRMHREKHLPLAQSIDGVSLLQAQGKPVTIYPEPEGRGVGLILDFGREINGGLEVEIEAPAGMILD